MSRPTEWTQVNGALRTGNLREGLQNRIADPLWMLARQWQFGAFKGEDAASPVRVRLRHGAVPVDHISRPGGGRTKLGAEAPPVEAIAESEPVTSGPAKPRRSAEAALAFLRRVPKGLRPAVLAALQKAFPLQEPDRPTRLMSLLVRKGFDAVAFRAASPTKLASIWDGLKASKTGRDALDRAHKSWVALYDARFTQPGRGRGTWNDARLEYGFTLHAAGVDADLVAAEYPGGRFDWREVDLASKSGKAFTAKPKAEENWLVPTRVRYAGMPARRFWDFEDGTVFFGQIDADAAELAQLVLAEFATVYPDDWYHVLAPMRTGALGRILEVRVYDTFGDSRTIDPAAFTDGPNRPWRFFELHGDKSAERGLSPWLYVPRIAEAAHEGPLLEQTEMMRDEAANLCWAIEHMVETASGDVRDRRRDWLVAREALIGQEDAPSAPEPSEDEAEMWTYTLETQVPPYWLPFLPEVDKNRATGMLRRARMGAWNLLGKAARFHAGPQGLMTRPDAPLRIHDEEVPRGGLELTRRFQAARDANGQLLVWASRRKRPAGHVRSSGRETDLATDADGRAVDAGKRAAARTAPRGGRGG